MDEISYEVKEICHRIRRPATAPDPRYLASPAEVLTIVRELQLFPDDARERFYVLFLNSQNALIGFHLVSLGTLSSTVLTAREVFGPALRTMGVAAVILAHNHPSGDPAPSRNDLALTRQLVDAGVLLDVRVHDHLVLGDGTDAFVSFAERGLAGFEPR